MHFSFSELCVILLVALLVIKPERMPEIIREGASFLKFINKGVQKLKQSLLHESSNERKF